ncbi:hypothetical protein GGI12_001370 [Dipsacomyces acuminosporus]|nr:hypothetical protein GGI12_001370 [Dipsacomyces acuminosporus]
MTLSADAFRLTDSGAQMHPRGSPREHPHMKMFAFESRNATATIQYNFDSTSNFPQPFLADSPRFHSSFEPSLRHLPCILFLHGNEPGGFDVARWMAGGISHAHQLCNPLMPSQFGSYSVFNVQNTNGSQQYVHLSGTYEGDTQPAYTRVVLDRDSKEKDGSSRNNNVHTKRKRTRPRFTVPAPPLGLLSLSRPGYLESSTSHTPTFLAQATAIAQLVENLGLPSVHVIAHQIAAPIALEMAGLAGFKQRVRSVSLIDPQLSPPGRSRRLSERLSLLGPEWARTRAAYNALARSSSDAYFQQVVSEICGTESIAEIKDDPALARLYEEIGVFFTHWNSRKPGVLTDILMWDEFDRKAWSLVKAPVLCITSTALPDSGEDVLFTESDAAREEEAKAALMSLRGEPEFARIAGSGRMLFPLGRVSDICLDFVYKHQT